MLSNLHERFAIYNFLWSQVEKANDPVGREASKKSFEAFRKFVRTEDRRQQLLEERMRDADDFIAAVAAEIEDLVVLQIS